MTEDRFAADVLSGVGHDRRTFVKRLVAGTAFAIPVVSSFDMRSLRMSSVSAQIPNSTLAAPLGYVIVEPARVLDTRGGAPIASGVTVTFDFTTLASNASAVKVNLTVTQPTAPGHLQVKARGSSVATSAINFVAGQTVANEITVATDASQDIELKNNSTGTVHMILDFVGYFAPLPLF